MLAEKLVTIPELRQMTHSDLLDLIESFQIKVHNDYLYQQNQEKEAKSNK